ncbi:MAG: helix-turn-helix transcriptional regulator [Dehalococcoidia bacterium]
MPVALEGTRQQILDLIQREGSLTVEQLAQSLGLASATIRRHLDILQRDHLVSFQQVRKKLGRPEYLYSLTEAGYESGRRDYQKLLCLLLTNLRSIESPTEKPNLVQSVLHQVADQLSAAYLVDAGTATAETRTNKLEQALTDIGFAPEISKQSGQLTIRLCNCPFRAAALCDESVCLIDRRLIQNILGSQPSRRSTICDGDHTCTYTVNLEH